MCAIGAVAHLWFAAPSARDVTTDQQQLHGPQQPIVGVGTHRFELRGPDQLLGCLGGEPALESGLGSRCELRGQLWVRAVGGCHPMRRRGARRHDLRRGKVQPAPDGR